MFRRSKERADADEKPRHWLRDWWITIVAALLVGGMFFGLWWSRRPQVAELGQAVSTADGTITVLSWSSTGDGSRIEFEACRSGAGNMVDVSLFRLEFPDGTQSKPSSSEASPSAGCLDGAASFPPSDGSVPTKVVYLSRPQAQWTVPSGHA